MSKKRISLDALFAPAKKSKSSEPLPPLTKRIFTLSFMSEFIVIYPFYVIMFGERGDVSAAGVGLLLAIWMIVSVVSEVPTGIIADRISKKTSLVLGRIMQLLTFAIWLFFPSFSGYLIGFIIWGIGEAFLSGAFQAYLYESLDDKHKKVFGKIYSRSSAFTMLAYTAGSFLAFAIGPNYPILLIVSILVSIISLGITLSLPETHSKVEVDVEVKPRILATALAAIRDNKLLRRVFVGAILVQGLMGMLGEYLPAYYQQVGTPTQLVALIMSITSATAVILYWWMHHIESQFAKYQIPIIVGFTALFALSFVGGTIVAVIGMFVYTRLLRMAAVNNETQIQHLAPNQARATLGSLYSFVAKLIAAGLVSTVGFFAINDHIVEPIRWSVMAVVAILVISWIYFSIWQKPLAKPDNT